MRELMRRIALLKLVSALWLMSTAWAHAAPPQAALPDPASVAYSDCFESVGYWGIGGKLCFWRCINKGSSLICQLGYEYENGGAWADAKPFEGAKISLTDNFMVEHGLRRITWLNLRGQPQLTATLAKGDWIWLSMEFDAGADSDGINSGRVVIRLKGRGDAPPTVKGPIVKDEQ